MALIQQNHQGMVMTMDGFYLAALQLVRGIGSQSLRKLMDCFGTAEHIWNASSDELLQAKCLNASALEAVISFRQQSCNTPERLYEQCVQGNISLCTFADDTYPDLLKHIFNPPCVLFVKGCLQPHRDCIAVVGSRKLSPYGRSVAESLSMDLAAAGISVVSGAARGIDTAAHYGAMKTGRTIAVLGCGVDVAYPPENRKLLADIAEHGAVISEYAPGTMPMQAFFPARNRIISGLSRGTLVVEAAEKSGSLITAELALSEGRDVFAVPGNIFSDTSRGCHRLIQQGAKLVTRSQDILEEYEKHGVERSGMKKDMALELSEEEALVYGVLSFDRPLSVDEIIYKLNGSHAANIAFLLLQMELKGIIEENASHNYVRAVKEGVL